MVVFICGSCNDSLKKSVVATHLIRCKPASISCCDCSKEFSDDSYAKHFQCISEDAKYGPDSQRSLYTKDKGAKKQEDWTSAIRETLKERNVSGRAEMVLHKLLEHANIPRMKNKFINFLSNCSVKVPSEIVEEVWSICEAATKKLKETHHQTPDVKANPVVQPIETPKNIKKKKKLKHSEGEEVESGETTLPESSEGPDQGESQVEGDDQTNGSSVITKQSKKKKKQSKEEGEGEEKENENEKADEEKTESNVDEKSTETNEVDNDVENSELKCDELKKKSKKKKRNHSETEENQEKSSNPNEEDELHEGSHDNECDSKKKKMADEKEKETTTTSDSPGDKDSDQINGNANEEEPESQPINWFKQLKRQIKEKETVAMKDFKKMVKKLKKSHNLTEDCSQLTAKARVKLMKRHNYCVADGQIKYTRLF